MEPSRRPKETLIFMNLPFLLKNEEEEGVMRFLFTFFRSHQDATQGTFIVDAVDFDMEVPEAKPGQLPAPLCPLIRMNVWLAPFDFGIKQHLQLHCCPSMDNPGLPGDRLVDDEAFRRTLGVESGRTRTSSRPCANRCSCGDCSIPKPSKFFSRAVGGGKWLVISG